MAITTIIFDIGQVLASFDTKNYLNNMELTEDKKEKVRLATFQDLEHWNEHDRGILTDEEFIKKSLQKVPGIEMELREFFKNIHYLILEYDYAEQWLLDLKKAGYQLCILSNYGKTTFAYAKKNFKFLKHVDHMIISSDVHYVKPEPEIYQILLERYKIKPEESIFIDDRADNLEMAAAFGIHTIQFKNQQQTIEELEKLGVKI